jgi:hypothetical protein
MGVLAAKAYDPATAVSTPASLRAMTALDTTNLRLTFTAPANGTVLVRLRGIIHGATTYARILLGILDGSTVRLRMSPMGSSPQFLATTMMQQEVVGVISGLTPGNSYTWDAAFGVEIAATSSNLKYGGPNNATANDAFGAFIYEIWSTESLLASKLYDPAVAATISTSTTKAVTAFDTTNLRNTFTAPASGNVLWRIRTQLHGVLTNADCRLGILDGATVRGRIAPLQGRPQTALTSSCIGFEGSAVITGLTPGNSYTFDAAYTVDTTTTPPGGGFKHGGPDDATTDNAFGATAFEIWAA